MALIKHRPQIRLYAPDPITPGNRVSATVVLEVEREVPVEAVTVTIRGTERAKIGSGEQTSVHNHNLLKLRATLLGNETIAPGNRELDFSFEVPVGAGPSYASRRASTEYVAEVRVDIDWWPDAVKTFALTVGHPKTEAREPRPRTYSTAPEGPTDGRPVLEASLSSEVVPSGGRMELAIGVVNERGAKLREVRVALVALQTLVDRRGKDRGTFEVERHHVAVPLDMVADALPFNFPIPDVPPSMQAVAYRLSWVLDIVGVVAWGSNLMMRLPLDVVPAGGVRETKLLAPAPVGSSRQREIWSKVARKHGLDFDGREMSASVGDVAVTVRLGHHDGGFALLGELEFPSLHLGLEGGRRGVLKQLLNRAFKSDLEFDDEHYVIGREEAQVSAFLGELSAFIYGSELDELSDEGIRFTTRHRTRKALERMCRIVDLARLLPAARRAIPAPASLRAHQSAWQAAATREGATLELARMALHLNRGEDQASVVTEWDSADTAYRTTVEVSVRDPIDEDYLFVSTEDQLPEGDATHYGADARALLARLVHETPHVRVESQALIVHLEPQLEDPTRALLLLKRLEALGALLRGSAGPYR